MPLKYTVLGGLINPPITLNFSGEPPVTAEDIQKQADMTNAAKIPHIRKYRKLKGRLAIVGGGASIQQHIKMLKEWPAEVWAINGAWHWCKANGIKARFVAVDPHAIVAQWAKGVTDAIVVTRCHPDVFVALKANNAKIRVIDIEIRNFHTGSSTATSCVYLAALSGYQGVTYFGCEGSYNKGQTHCYMDEDRKSEMIVVCGGKQYLTAPDYLCQSLELAHWARGCGTYIEEQSGGLLRAMIKNPKYEIGWVSETLFKMMKPKGEKDKKDDDGIRKAYEEIGKHEPGGPLAADPNIVSDAVARINDGDVSGGERCPDLRKAG